MRNAKILPIIASVFLIGFVACSTGTKKTEVTASHSLTGRWEGIDRTGKPGAFHFFQNGSVILIIDGKPLGGPDSTAMGQLKFTADYTKDPIELDIIGIDSTGAERGKILMIVKFMSNDRIKIRTNFNDERPGNFDEETIDDTILLDRKKD
jgi:hypothetical protein